MVSLPRSPSTPNPISTQEHPAAVEVLLVVDIQSSPSVKLGTLSRSQLLLALYYSTGMSVLGLRIVYIPQGALSRECCDFHLGFSS